MVVVGCWLSYLFFVNLSLYQIRPYSFFVWNCFTCCHVCNLLMLTIWYWLLIIEDRTVLFKIRSIWTPVECRLVGNHTVSPYLKKCNNYIIKTCSYNSSTPILIILWLVLLVCPLSCSYPTPSHYFLTFWIQLADKLYVVKIKTITLPNLSKIIDR